MSLKCPERVMLQFLELYQKHDCLWNYRLEKYKNKDARKNALNSIVKEMEISGLTIIDLKNKIKTIRTMYKKNIHWFANKKKKQTKYTCRNRFGTKELIYS